MFGFCESGSRSRPGKYLFSTRVAGLIFAAAVARAEPVEARPTPTARQQEEQVADPLRPTDELLEQRVEAALAEDELVRSYDVVVNVLDAVVTLYGTVDTNRERERAGGIAADVSGVVEVGNEIAVEKEILPGVPSDNVIHDRLVEALADRGIDSLVEIAVEDGLATLRGTVSSREERRALSELAFRAGAVLVRNEVEVEES